MIRPSFGTDPAIVVTVAGHGEKNGRPLIDYQHPDGTPRWAYLHQIDEAGIARALAARVTELEAALAEFVSLHDRGLVNGQLVERARAALAGQS